MHDSNLNGFLQRSKTIKSYLELDCIVSAKTKLNTEERKLQLSIDCGLKLVMVSLLTVVFYPLLAFHAFNLPFFSQFLHRLSTSAFPLYIYIFCLSFVLF